MGEMASSVAHELNQPLTAITNYCNGMVSRIKGQPIDTEALLAALEKTAKQAQRAGQIIQRIRSFVKRSEPNRTPADVADDGERGGRTGRHRAAPAQRAAERTTWPRACRWCGRPDPDRAGAGQPAEERRRSPSTSADRPPARRSVELRVLPKR